jgi:hypothetical protein
LIATGFLLIALFERREVMIFVESCVYYQDSKCMLKGGCCDLNCEMTDSERGDQSYDEIDAFTRWEIEKARGGEGTPNLKSN